MSHTTDEPSMYDLGYHDGYLAAGHKHLCDEPEYPDDPDYMEGWDDGFADGEVEAEAEDDEEYDEED